MAKVAYRLLSRDEGQPVMPPMGTIMEVVEDGWDVRRLVGAETAPAPSRTIRRSTWRPSGASAQLPWQVVVHTDRDFKSQEDFADRGGAAVRKGGSTEFSARTLLEPCDLNCGSERRR